MAFVVLVVLSPLRGRVVLATHRVGDLYGDYTDVLLFVSDVALLATLGLWALERMLRRRPLVVGPWFVVAPVGALLAAAWIGVATAVDRTVAMTTAARLTLLAALALFVVDRLDRLARLVWPVAGMIVVQAVVALGQAVGQRSLGWRALGERVLAPSMAVSIVTGRDGTRYLRAYGLADHPNILGGVLAFGLLVLVALAPLARRAGLLAVVVALGEAALFVTFSRGAWIGFLAGLVVLLGATAWRRDRAGLRAMAGCGAVGALLVVPFVVPFRHALAARTGAARGIATEQRSVDERTALTDAATRLVSAHPLLGVGAGDAAVALRRAEPVFAYPYQPAHVVLLDVTVELGVVGGGALLVLTVAPWCVLARRGRRARPELVAATAVVTAVTVVGLFDYYPWSYSAGRIWLWLSIGVWTWAYRQTSTRGDLRAA